MFLVAYILSIIIAFCGFVGFQKSVKKLDSDDKIRETRMWLIAAIILLCNALAIATAYTLIYFRAGWWVISGYLCVFIGLCHQLCDYYQEAKLLWRNDNVVIAEYLVSLHDKNILENNWHLAKEYIVRACELDPQEPEYWLKYAMLERDIKEAEKHIELARSLIEEKSELSNKLISDVEFTKGCIYLKRDFETAIKHLRKSLELFHSQERVEYIRKVEKLHGAAECE